MSYRLIDSNEIAIKYPEVNEMDCIYVDLGNGFSISVNKSQVDTQGRYCPECLYSPTCYGADINKPACGAFVPRVRQVDCKDGGENDN